MVWLCRNFIWFCMLLSTLFEYFSFYLIKWHHFVLNFCISKRKFRTFKTDEIEFRKIALFNTSQDVVGKALFLLYLVQRDSEFRYFIYTLCVSIWETSDRFTNSYLMYRSFHWNSILLFVPNCVPNLLAKCRARMFLRVSLSQVLFELHFF